MPTAPRRRRRAASSGLWAQKKTPTAVDAFALNENENVRAFPALIMPIPVDIRGFSSTSPASPGLSRFLNYPVPLQGAYWARSLHMLGAYWNFVLMSLHLGLHWSMALAPLQRAFRGKAVLLPVAGAVVVLFGVTAFLRREVGAYLLGQIQFTIFDFEEPLVLFFLDYLAMMGLFVWTGHYLGLLLRKLSRPRKGGQK